MILFYMYQAYLYQDLRHLISKITSKSHQEIQSVKNQ